MGSIPPINPNQAHFHSSGDSQEFQQMRDLQTNLNTICGAIMNDEGDSQKLQQDFQNLSNLVQGNYQLISDALASEKSPLTADQIMEEIQSTGTDGQKLTQIINTLTDATYSWLIKHC